MPNVDLQVVSIDPTKTRILVRKQCTVVCDIKNNGPAAMQPGDAKISITVNGLRAYKPVWVASKGWKKETIHQTEGGSYEVHATNSRVLEVNDVKYPKLKFTVKRRDYGPIDITVASTVRYSSDVDGANQSASTIIE